MIAFAENAVCDVRVDCDGWAGIEPRALSELCFLAVQKRFPVMKGAVSVLFTDNAAIAALNASFRGKDGPTNVLSFPGGDAPQQEQRFLGDIALALEISRSEAEDRGVTLRDHAAHLLVHGMMHLIGYDHDEEAAAAVMEEQESAVLATLGVPDPYAVAND